MERLHKYLARCGVSSRREAELLIIEGRVKVNGKIIQGVGTKIDPEKDVVELNNRRLSPPPPTYIMLNKPAGYITSLHDEWGRPTVLELLKGIKERVLPVGRLDLHSEGLLLLTNDGDLAFRLMHPRYHVEKRYLVRVRGRPEREEIKRLERGMELEDGRTAPAKVRAIGRDKGEDATLLEVTLREGKKRQIRRMLKALGYPVISLIRVAIGDLTLGDLPKGAFRKLTREEVRRLQEAVGLPPRHEGPSG